MLAMAELSWDDWDDARHELGECVNALIADRKLATPEPLLAYGVLLSWEHEPEKAGNYIAEALKYAPQDPFVLQELGRVQCLNLDWYSGNESLKKALDAGADPEARFMRAEALIWAGTPNEAEAEMNLYLNGRDPKSMPPRVRTVWTNIQDRKKDEAVMGAAKARAKARGEESLDYLNHPPKNLPDFEPATDQAPLAAILASVGRNVSEFFATLPNICSMEKVHQEALNHGGKTTSGQENKYRYLLLASNERWGPTIEEYRANFGGQLSSQVGSTDNYMLTSGFASAPVVFHPAYQRGSSFRLLGREKLKGRNTFVVAYAQEPARARIFGSFQLGEKATTTYTQGIAWIDSENYQIIRLATDLLTPLPQIKLKKETTEIDFSEVHFKRLPTAFWLPDMVTVTLDWNGKFLRNQHAYSDFLLSDVESTQKIGNPKEAEKTSGQLEEAAPDNNLLEDHALSLVPPAKKH